MLANALVCVALVALAANAILSTGMISARIAVRRIAQTYASQESSAALDAVIAGVQPYARAGAFPNPLPELRPIPAHCSDPDPPCAFLGSGTITLLRRDPATPLACGAGTGCAVNEETNAYINEGRIVARISVFVRAADGTPLAQRDSEVALRTFAVPPYVAIAGSADGTFDSAGGPHGEDAGLPPVTPNPCAVATPGQAGDTVVRVAYENAQSGECSNGSSWRTTGY